MSIEITGSEKEKIIILKEPLNTKEMHFYATRQDFLRMLKEHGGAEYQYLASIRALFYVDWEYIVVDTVYGINLKPVMWHDWDKSVVVNFYVENRINVQYIIYPKDYNAWKVIRKMLIKLDKQGIQLFPQELENL